MEQRFALLHARDTIGINPVIRAIRGIRSIKGNVKKIFFSLPGPNMIF